MSSTTSIVLTTEELIERLRTGSSRERYFLPMVSPVEFAETSLPIDPYLLGLLLGDGCFRGKVEFCSADVELIESAVEALPAGTSYTAWTDPRNGLQTIGIKKQDGRRGGIPEKNPLVLATMALGLFGHLSVDKFIPAEYKISSIKNRLALLQGLLDTDGTSSHSAVVFNSSSLRLVEDVVDLVQSLGGTAYVSDKIPSYTYRNRSLSGKRAYSVSIRLPSKFTPFRLPRKVESWSSRPHNEPFRAIVSIEFSRKAQAKCIRVDAVDNLYVTDGFSVTHNTSIAKALASHFDLDVYYLPLGDLKKDADLTSLLGQVRPRSMLLLEDVDVFSAATSREAEHEQASLSGLLNALDGLTTPHGVVKVLTTNNIDALDPALIRPGRIDIRKEFTALSQDQGERLFRHFYKYQPPSTVKFEDKSPSFVVGAMKMHLDEPEKALTIILDGEA